jgi:heat shock protein HslJ
MKTIFALTPLAALLAACTAYGDPYAGGGHGAPYPPAYPQQYPEPYPAPYPHGSAPYAQGATYRAIGTEPFWDLEIGSDLVFTDRGNGTSVAQPAPQPIVGVAGEIYRTPRIEANVTHVRCSDGMSDRTYPDTVQVTVDGRMYRGCGAPSAFFSAVDERGDTVGGMAPSGPAVELDRTRWRVVAIDGQPTPPSADFGIDFDNGRLSAVFGCNRLNATYAQTGAAITVGTIAATRMACPDSGFERQGLAALGAPLTLSSLDPNHVGLSGRGGSIDLERR